MLRIDTSCPKCGAPFAKKLSLIHTEGISTVNTSTQSVGVTNTIGKVTISSAGTTVGVQQSVLSKSAAPPALPPFQSSGAQLRGKVALYGYAIAWVVPFLFIKSFNSGVAFVGTILGLSAIVAVIVTRVETAPTAQELRGYETNSERERHALEEWNSTFACSACGHRFIPVSTTDFQNS